MRLLICMAIVAFVGWGVSAENGESLSGMSLKFSSSEGATVGGNDTTENPGNKEIRHMKVFYEKGEFAGWPANHGIWIWENEILVGFVRAKHKKKKGHTYDRETARDFYARSLDGGMTWSIEEAFAHGQTAERYNNNLGDGAKEPVLLEAPINFNHPGLALTFQRVTNTVGPTHFYYSYDRGKSWRGAFKFPQYPPGTTNRTDYIVNGQHDLFSFVSIGHGKVGVSRTVDGGVSWELVSWIGPDRTDTSTKGFLTMPSSVRLSSNKILSIIRQREDDGRDLLSSYLTEDNGLTWKKLVDPVSNTGVGGSPPALVKLKDGRLCLAYAVRAARHSRLAVKFSKDDGKTWGKEIVLRSNDGATPDVGYPRMVQRPDGRLVVVYYWNNAANAGSPPYRYIAATIFDPRAMK